MTNFDDQVRIEIESEQEVPAIVNQKWNAALGDIRRGAVSQNSPKKNKVLRMTLKSVGGLAAAIVLLFSVALVNPVFAENIPFMKNILQFFNREPAPVFAGNAITDTAVAERAQPVTQVERESGFAISEAYCDGTLLVFSTKLTLKDDLPEAYTLVNPEFKAMLNGQELQLASGFLERMYRAEPGVYVGSVAVDISDFGITEDFELSVEIPSVTGLDPKTMVLDDRYGDKNMTPEQLEAMMKQIEEEPMDREMLTYTEEYETFAVEDIAFAGTIPFTADLVKSYPVGETKENFTLESVCASPAFTQINLALPEGHYCVVKDNLGNELTQLKLGNGRSDYLKPLYNGTTSLEISVHNRYDKEDDNLATFTVPVDEGYVDYKEHPELLKPESGEVTYIPDFPPLPEDYLARRKNSDTYELGETFTLTGEELVTVEDGSQDVTISNMQVFDSPQAAGIDVAEMISSQEKIDEKYAGMAFVTFDVTLKNTGAKGSVYGEDETEDKYCIANLFRTASKYPGKFAGEGSELEYFDHHGSGSGYYYFPLGSDEELTGKVGFFLSREGLENGYYQLTINGYRNQEKYDIYVDLPAYQK